MALCVVATLVTGSIETLRTFYTTQAVEILTQYAFQELKLHRLEINLRPENASSRRVAEKARYIFEGERPR